MMLSSHSGGCEATKRQGEQRAGPCGLASCSFVCGQPGHQGQLWPWPSLSQGSKPIAATLSIHTELVHGKED